MSKKDNKAVCPHHPEAELVEVDASPEMGGKSALACPKKDCNYVAVLERTVERPRFLHEQATTVRLSHAKLRVAADGSKFATLEFQIFLNKDKLYQLELPKS